MIALLAAAVIGAPAGAWARPAWGSAPRVVAARMGLPADGGEARRDIAGMDAKVRGAVAYDGFKAAAKFFFKADRLAVISLKLDDPKRCEAMDLHLASEMGRPVLFRHSDSGIFVDAWNDPRSGDRLTLSGGPGAAAYCLLSIGPPRRDRFNTF